MEPATSPARPILPVPRELCSSCRMCCRFSDPDRSPWAIRGAGLPDFPAAFSAPRPLRLLPAAPSDDIPVWSCSELDPTGRGCGLWGGHPADCRIYPLLVVFREGAFRIVLDPDCPFSSREDRAFFRRRAEAFLSEEWSFLTPEALAVLRPFAESEDRPHFQEILLLPSPAVPRRGSVLS
ncbi:MAG: hypothetical protein ACP5OP_08765 [Leptospirillia bacterium]